MRLSSVSKACCVFACLLTLTNVNAEKKFYPPPSSAPFEVGSEDFRDRYMTLRELEGVHIDFTVVRASGEEFGVTIPDTLYEQVQKKIETAGLLFLSEEEMMMTPGQPLMNLWPLFEGQLPETVPPVCSTSLWAGFQQSATLLRQPENQYKLSTWGGGDNTYECEGRGQWMADSILKQIDSFVDDFKKAQRDPEPVIVANTIDVPLHCSQSWITHLNMFATNETRLNDNIKPILDKLNNVAARCNTFNYIIETHADQRADADYNRLLTEGRANSIKHYLISQGLEYHRIHMRPLGESAPIATGTKPEDHAKNRRVVIIPIKQEDIASAQLEAE